MHKQWLPVMTVLVCLAGAASAEEKAAAPEPATKPKVEPVLTHVPAGAMAYVVINHVKGATGKIDEFMTETGIKALVMDDPSLAVLDVLQAVMQFGEGFDPGGGFGVVMLDPKPFDVDLGEALAAMAAEKEAEEAPEPKPKAKDKPKLPVVAFVPAASIESLLPTQPMAKDGAFMKVNMHFGTVYAGQVGGYVLLSPLKGALAAVVEAKARASGELSKAQKLAIARADFAVHVDMQLAKPLLDFAMKLAKDKMAGMGALVGAGGMGGMGGMAMPHQNVELMLAVYGDLLGQVKTVTLTGRLVKEGVVLDELVDFVPGSALAKAVADPALKPSTASLLAGVPNLNYVAAMGMTGHPFMSLAGAMTTSYFKAPPLAKLPAKTKADAAKLAKASAEQVTGAHMAVGLAPKGSKEVMGIAYVVRCKDSKKFVALIPESIKLQKELLPAMMGEMAAKMEITYKEKADTLGDLPVHEMTVTIPLPKNIPPMQQAMMRQARGGDKMRYLIAAPDAKTVVMTSGGGKKLLQQVIETAKAGKDAILVGGEVKPALKYLPKDLALIALFNGANAQEMQARQMEAMLGQRLPQSPLDITCKQPAVIAAGIEGKTVHGVVYVPKLLVKEVTQVIVFINKMKEMREHILPPQPPPLPEGGEDF